MIVEILMLLLGLVLGYIAKAIVDALACLRHVKPAKSSSKSGDYVPVPRIRTCLTAALLLVVMGGCQTQQSPPVTIDKSQRITFQGPVTFPETVTFSSSSGEAGQDAEGSTAARGQGVLTLNGAWESNTAAEGQTAEGTQTTSPEADVEIPLIP